MIKVEYYIILIVSFVLISCNQKEVVSGLSIQEEELINIMIDLTLAQAAVTNYPSSQKDSMRNVYKYQLEKIYKRPMAEIDSTLNVVNNNPSLNKKLQKLVLDSLKVMEEKTNKVK